MVVQIFGGLGAVQLPLAPWCFRAVWGLGFRAVGAVGPEGITVGFRAAGVLGLGIHRHGLKWRIAGSFGVWSMSCGL